MKLFFQTGTERIVIGPVCPVQFPLHVHIVCEVVHLMRGSIRMTVGKQSYTLHAGDTIACFPSVAHSYDEISPDADGLCFVFVPELISEFAMVFRSMRPVSPMLPSAEASEGMKASAVVLHDLLRVDKSPLRIAYLHVFLAHMLSSMELTPLEKDMNTDLVQQVLQYVADHFKEPLTLDSVSMAVGISKSHLSHLFSEQLNINFRKYINILRVDEACQLLRTTDLTVTQICYSCGYNNLRTFHRAFLDETTMQPNDFRLRTLGETEPEQRGEGGGRLSFQ